MPGQAKLEDSNVANIGGKDHKNAVKNVAANAPEWKGAGDKYGIEIWRIEKFKVKRWPRDQYGQFYSGDSYIILHTYKVEDKKQFNIFFWLGKDTTQDEAGTAAYKTVELDTLLDDLPVQFRECQHHECENFLKLFNDFTYLDGGIDSGFRHVKPAEYKARLMHFKGKKPVRCYQVPLETKSLNAGDVFLLDLGLQLIQWNGASAGPLEKRKANEIARNLKVERKSKPVLSVIESGDEEDEPNFWATLGGPGPIADAIPDEPKVTAPPKLFRLSDASSTMVVTPVDAKLSSLDTNDIFICDTPNMILIWVGNGANSAEKGSAINYATNFLTQSNRPLTIPIVRLSEGFQAERFFNPVLA